MSERRITPESRALILRLIERERTRDPLLAGEARRIMASDRQSIEAAGFRLYGDNGYTSCILPHDDDVPTLYTTATHFGPLFTPGQVEPPSAGMRLSRTALGAHDVKSLSLSFTNRHPLGTPEKVRKVYPSACDVAVEGIHFWVRPISPSDLDRSTIQAFRADRFGATLNYQYARPYWEAGKGISFMTTAYYGEDLGLVGVERTVHTRSLEAGSGYNLYRRDFARLDEQGNIPMSEIGGLGISPMDMLHRLPILAELYRDDLFKLGLRRQPVTMYEQPISVRQASVWKGHSMN